MRCEEGMKSETWEHLQRLELCFREIFEAASPTEVLRDLFYSATLIFPASGNCLAIATFAMPVAKWQPFALIPRWAQDNRQVKQHRGKIRTLAVDSS